MFTNDEPMKNILLFVHVPKTAGTSFRKSLESQGQAKMLYDYGEHPESSPALLENLHEDGSIKDESIFDPDKLNVICGHVRFQKYARCIEPQNVLSILRNPVERVVSEYQHLVRHAGMATTFADFIAMPKQINKQYRMLDGTDTSGGGLFGLTSHYDCFLELVKKRFNISVETSVLNQAPDSDHAERFTIPVDEINRAYELNRKDLALFFSVAKQFRKSLQAAGVSVVPDKEAQCNCRLDRDRKIVGWVAREDAECIFVELNVNGQRRVIVSLDQKRPDVVQQGLSKNPMCGFSYPLAMLGARPGDDVGMRVAGAPHCSRTLRVILNGKKP
jgi:hypothetical protein